MIPRKLTIAALAIALASLVFAQAGAAQDMNWNQRTFLTFDAPVQLPGVTLAAGTYLFRLADLASTRHVIQILSQDGSEMYATILAVPRYRTEPKDENVVMFAEMPAHMTPAVKLWFYPGDLVGHEFIYPKEQAERIASATRQDVLTAESAEATAKVKTASPPAQTETSATGGVRESERAVGTTGQQPATRAAAPERTETRRLPKTGSQLPFIGLLGLFAIFGVASVRLVARRMA
ncbi:MAG: LPXTG cell wall anchor domain-containing protein [Acidobacteria bacterium]|nr:LPXTG cell wall anchor domain-containing protein [Acidobacteriota bacterium]